MGPGALAGLRVADHADRRGALYGRILGDLGAEVVRVPPIPDPNDLAHAHRNAKRAAGDAAELESLMADPDLFVDNTGMGFDELTERHPALPPVMKLMIEAFEGRIGRCIFASSTVI